MVVAAVGAANGPPPVALQAKPAPARLAAALTSIGSFTPLCSGPTNTEVICGQLTTSPLTVMFPREAAAAPQVRPTPTPTVAPAVTVKGVLVPEQTSTPSLYAVSSMT